MTMEETKVIVSGVITKGKNILMVKEGKKKCFGQWNIPSGHQEYGENIIKGAARETFEETGLKISITSLLGIYNYVIESGNHSVRFVFLAEVSGGKIKFDGKEIIDAKWMPYDDFLKLKDKEIRTPKILKKILKDAISGKKFPISIIHEEKNKTPN
jgi:ADP-ribose pyrophosphatase YjhB (NUDIX family)